MARATRRRAAVRRRRPHHLARVPRQEVPRSVPILLTTGHFATHTAWGLEDFLDRHRDDLVPKIAAALCLEHLGALA